MTWKDHYYFDKALPFGPRSAPFIFNQLSESLEWLLKHYLKIPSIIHNLDNFFIDQPHPSSLCATTLCKILTLFTELNIPLALNKTFHSIQALEFMGITLDSVKMQARLPEDKLIWTLLSTWSSKRACFLHDLQSLIGSLQFACKVARMPLYATHNQPNPQYLQTRATYFPQQKVNVIMWQLFLDHWNGVSLFLPSPPPPPSPNNPLISIFIPMPQVLLALEPFSIISGFKVHGFQVTTLLASPGRRFTLYTLPACSGAPCGPIGEFVFIAITKQRSLFYPLS